MEINIKGIGEKSFTIIAIASIISFTVCFLATKGYDSNISIENEKIEVTTNYSNLIKNAEGS